MASRKFFIALGGAVLLVFAVAGCSEQGKRLNAPPQGDSARPSSLQPMFVRMTDNATLHDTAIADIHFEPNVSDLSGLGVRKLTRMGELLSTVGGVVRYETGIRDEQLVADRLGAARSFLEGEGFNMEKITVEAGLARSASMSATDAIEAKNKQSESSPETADAGFSVSGGDPS